MGTNEKRPEFLIGILKFWTIRFIIGSSIVFVAGKVDNYLDKKFGPAQYDKMIIKAWETIKGFM